MEQDEVERHYDEDNEEYYYTASRKIVIRMSFDMPFINMILDHVWELFGQLANETVETINRESIRMDAPPHLWMYPALLDEFDHNAFDGVHAAIADTLPPDSDDDS